MSENKESMNKKSNKNSEKKKQHKPKMPIPATGGILGNKNFLLVVFIIILMVYLVKLFSEDLNDTNIDRTEFMAMMQDSTVKVDSLSLQKTHDGILVTGRRLLTEKELADQKEVTNPLLQSSYSKRKKDSKIFITNLLAISEEQILTWEKEKQLKVHVIHETPSWFDKLFVFLPILILILFFWFMMSRQSGGGPGGKGLFSFGKSKARVNDPNDPQTTFADVAGAEEAKQDLEELVSFLKDHHRYSKLGGRIPKGALLVGPPGTGKTLLARAVAGEAKVPFFSMSGSDFVEMFVGVGASRVRDLFENGKKNAPCIIFIDEIDAVGRQRGAGLGGGHDEREQTLNQLLVEMDGFAANEGVILIAASNRPDVLDKALLRPGRFDRQITVGLPDLRGREAIIKVHLDKRKVPLSDDVDIHTVAKGTPGLAGADLENLVNEAALLAARFGADKVSQIDFEEARDKLWMGAERKTLLMTEEERRLTAYHEAGHALVTLEVKNADPLHKITIIPRGRALGVTMSLPERDRVSMGKENIEDQIAILMGGRLAEMVMFNHMSTGASNDIERASDLARKMVTVWGFNEKLGPINYGKAQEEVFLGREIAQHRDFSEKTAEEIDNEVRKIIGEQVDRVQKFIEENKDRLILLSEALLEHEVLDREEIDKIMAGEKLESTKKSRQYQDMVNREKKKRAKLAKIPRDPGTVKESSELTIEDIEKALAEDSSFENKDENIDLKDKDSENKDSENEGDNKSK